MFPFTDQLQQQITLPDFPKRIVSLVPSQTELLYALGLDEEVVGITKFCVHPEAWYRIKTRVGGTKTVHIDQVLSLQPDLIIANKEENIKDQIDQLLVRAPVWVSDINTLEDAYAMITGIGAITNTTAKAISLIQKIKEGFDHLKRSDLLAPLPRCAYIIWKDPYMTVGRDTFIHDLLTHCGLQNVFADRLRYPSVTLSDLNKAQCQLILLSSEPYPFKEKHKEEIQEAVPHAKVMLVDGEMFSWYGSRLLEAAKYLRNFIQSLG